MARMTIKPTTEHEMLVSMMTNRIAEAPLGDERKFKFCLLVRQKGLDEPQELLVEVMRSKYNMGHFIARMGSIQLPMLMTQNQLRMMLRTVVHNVNIMGFAVDDPWFRIIDREEEDVEVDPFIHSNQETGTFRLVRAG